MRGVLLSLSVAAAVVGASAAHAGQQPDSLGAGWSPLQGGQAKNQVRAGQIVPLSTATEAVRRRIPGRLLDAGLEPDGPRQVYRVRWAAADGRRLDIIADAATGQVIRQEGR